MKPSIIQTSVGQPLSIGQSYMSPLFKVVSLVLFLSSNAITHSHAQCEFSVPCPITIEQISDDGICGSFVSFDTPTGSGSCAMSAVIQTDGTGLGSESLFPLGSTTLTYTVMDDIGNMASCDIEVFITDTDSDNDGFPNCEDICPATANNIDSDGDGICDDFDPCFGADNVDSDMDGVCDALDLCEGEDDTLDDDGDNTPNCLDNCPDDPNKTEPGICGCGFDDSLDTDEDGTIDCLDGCPDDPNKTVPGSCGCNVPDVDSDGDGFLDCADPCPADPFNTDNDGDGVCDDADLCFGLDNIDDDGDGVCNSLDQCPDEDDRLDTDEDGTPDCQDDCPEDPNKVFPGICGCGEDDNLDSDGDFVVDCIDGCPTDPNKISPGICGCHVPDIDSDNDGIFDCDDPCDNNLVGMPCDDGNPNTVNDMVQMDCTCQGTGGSNLSITCSSDIMIEANASGGAIVAFPPAMATSSCIVSGNGQDCNDLAFNPADFQDLGTFGGSRYLLSTYKKRWSAAQAEATDLNGYLVTINDTDENAFIANQINEYVHIGYSDAGTEGNFIWTDNSINSYTNLGAFWNNTNTRDFAVMEWWSGNGTWELVGQWTSKKFVVEIPCNNGGGSGLMVTQSQGPPSGSFFPIGIHPISFTATDACGNMASCNFLITVTESTEICDGIDNNNNGMIDENLLDSDGDGICDDIDICPGFDDLEDKNNNGIPDGCEEPDGASVGDKVFDDLNNNGLQDDGEPGMEDIFVALYQNGIFIDFRYTDSEGIYSFENIAPGDYQIKFANPNEGYEPIAQGVGNNGTIDSDADFFGFTEVFSLVAGESNYTIDAGFHNPTNVTEYCEAMGLKPWKQYIRNVTLVSINNTSFKERYGDFTHLSTNLEKKADYTISLQAGFSYTHHNEYFRVWIDYNQNGSFQEANELVFEGIYLASTGTNGQAAIPITGQINIPENILEGSTRMRVAMQKNHFAEPCETFNLGEVEDYTVNILPSNSPLLAAQAFNLQGYQNGQHTQLQWGSNTGYKNDHFDIERSADGMEFEYLATTENVHWTDRLEFFANLDEQPLLGDNFYRIKKVHLDGTHEYSNIVKINFNIDLTKFLLFPNPAHEQVTIGLLPLRHQAGSIQLYNVYGQLVFEQTWAAFPERVDIDLKAYLNGVYTVFVQPEKGQRLGRKLVVQRMY